MILDFMIIAIPLSLVALHGLCFIKSIVQLLCFGKCRPKTITWLAWLNLILSVLFLLILIPAFLHD